MNVFINTKVMKDRACAEELNAKAGFLYYNGTAQADKIFDIVKDQLM